MAPPRQPHRGNVGWAKRARPKNRCPPHVILFNPATRRQNEAVPLQGIGACLSAGKSFLFGDFHAPTDAISFITGFFGMNFQRLAGAGDRPFFASIASMVLLPIAMLWLIRRQGIR